MITEQQLETLLDLNKFQQGENQFQRIPLEAEAELMKKIRQGDYKNIRIAPFTRMDDNLGSMALDKKTGYIYLTVTAIALSSRTAIDCGVSPDEAFDLSDALLYALSGCNTVEEIHNIFQLTAVMFAKRVAKLHESPRSYQVEQARNYISRNIFQKITLKELADYTGLTETYLCHLFSKEVGMTIHNYIQREKVNVACNLLEHTPRSISEISTYLGFQSQSNFAAIFRKWKQMMPSQYRKKMYREVY